MSIGPKTHITVSDVHKSRDTPPWLPAFYGFDRFFSKCTSIICPTIKSDNPSMLYVLKKNAHIDTHAHS